MRYALLLTLTLALCFAAQSFALRSIGGRTTKSESNFFSSLGRIQAGAMGEPQAMVLGSSITGRLPDRAQGFPGWANMGCDGGSAVDGLRAMDEGILPTAPLLVIEANTLQLALDDKPVEIAGAMRGAWFLVRLRFPRNGPHHSSPAPPQFPLPDALVCPRGNYTSLHLKNQQPTTITRQTQYNQSPI